MDAELDAALQTFAVEKVAGIQAHIVRMVAHVEQLHQLIVIDGQDSAGDHFLTTFAGIFLLQAFNFLPVVFHLLLKLLQIRCRKLQLLPCLQLLILFVQRLDFSFMIFSVRFELLQKGTVLLKLYLQLFRFLLVGLRIQLLLESVDLFLHAGNLLWKVELRDHQDAMIPVYPEHVGKIFFVAQGNLLADFRIMHGCRKIIQILRPLKHFYAFVNRRPDALDGLVLKFFLKVGSHIHGRIKARLRRFDDGGCIALVACVQRLQERNDIFVLTVMRFLAFLVWIHSG